MIARLCRWYIVKVIGNLLTNQFQRPLVCILSLWKIHQCLLKFTMTFFPTKRIIKDLISQIIYSNVCLRCLHFYVEWIHKHEVLSWNWNSYVQHMIAKTHCIYSTVLVFPMINRFLPQNRRYSINIKAMHLSLKVYKLLQSTYLLTFWFTE